MATSRRSARSIGELEIPADLVDAGELGSARLELAAAGQHRDGDNAAIGELDRRSVSSIGELEILADLVDVGELAPSSAARWSADGITAAAAGELAPRAHRRQAARRVNDGAAGERRRGG